MTTAERKDLIAEVEARELISTSIHEAGHLIMMWRFGIVGDARIWRTPSGELEQKAWLGTCRIWSDPGCAPYPDVKPAPTNWRSLVGVAGLVAEQINQGVTDPDDVLEAIDMQICCGEASDTDMGMIGETLFFSDVASTIEHLTEDWHRVQREAENLRLVANDD